MPEPHFDPSDLVRRSHNAGKGILETHQDGQKPGVDIRACPQLKQCPADLPRWDNRPIMETSNFELSFLDRGPEEQPVAHVRMKARENLKRSGKSENAITSPCHNMVEMDAEIRRLHAELDEIRAQARKRFYKAQAAVTGV